jgi:hypothetical protein
MKKLLFLCLLAAITFAADAQTYNIIKIESSTSAGRNGKWTYDDPTYPIVMPVTFEAGRVIVADKNHSIYKIITKGEQSYNSYGTLVLFEAIDSDDMKCLLTLFYHNNGTKQLILFYDLGRAGYAQFAYTYR